MTALYKVRLHCITHTNTASSAAASSDSDLVAEPRCGEELPLDESVVTVPCRSNTPSPEFESKFMNINCMIIICYCFTGEDEADVTDNDNAQGT